jgi:hypothetical protein
MNEFILTHTALSVGLPAKTFGSLVMYSSPIHRTKLHLQFSSGAGGCAGSAARSSALHLVQFFGDRRSRSDDALPEDLGLQYVKVR